MGKLIAITGKGGVGKTTISSLLVKCLINAGKGPVLAIDADPNSCLDAALGVEVTSTVGRAREEVREEVSSSPGAGINAGTNIGANAGGASTGSSSAGISRGSGLGATGGLSKQEMLSIKLEESLVESAGFDLIAMGRPEGAGCYCYANNVLKSIIADISSKYPYVILDNEAGLENLSRRIVQKVDTMVLVSDASNAGLQTLVRLYELAQEMKMQYSRLVLVINRLRSGKLPDKVNEIKEKTKADCVIGVPDDAEIAQFAEESRSFLEVSENNSVLAAIAGII